MFGSFANLISCLPFISLEKIVKNKSLWIKETTNEISKHQYHLHKQNTCVILDKKKLKMKNQLNYPNSSQLKKPQVSANFILEELPIEILWIIFEYLHPIHLGYIRLTCKKFAIASYDQELWRRVCFTHEHFFIWQSLHIPEPNFAFSTNIQIVGIVDDLWNKLNFVCKKKKKGFKIRLPNPIFKICKNELTEFKNKKIVPSTTRLSRLLYIQELEQPEQVLIEKISQINKIKKVVKSKIKQNKEIQKRNEHNLNFERGLLKITGIPLVIFLYSSIAFTILLNLYMIGRIDKKHRFWVCFPFVLGFSAVLLSITLTVIFLYSRYVRKQTLIVVMIEVFVMLPIALIILKITGLINWTYSQTFIPLFFTFLFCVITSLLYRIYRDLNYLHWYYIIGQVYLLLQIITPFLFLLFLALKLDSKVNWKWNSVFIPLFISGLTPFVGGSICGLIYKLFVNRRELFFSLLLCLAIFAVHLPAIIFEILLILFLETDSIPSFSYVMIPIYFFDFFIFIFATFLGFFWFKIRWLK
ncbi:fam11a [Anaeramoeba flamelloides]|uniref:Fam11a n=1 Tax=Anaeramoeba flamelloides TaxID=1746091 RepID=A0ABQ8ZDZ8_9EUKA|nr:fam11a [Anaeramoeba flamelloides]